MHLFVRKVKQYIDKHQLIANGERLLVACSGGADSIALVHVINELKETYECEVAIVHTDHQLRGEESAEDFRFVEQLAKRLDIPFYGTALNVPNRLKEEGGNVQVICREERYGYFERIMATYGYDKLLLGHHADDQIENVIMTLARGSISSSITGIPKKRYFSIGQIIRPFLSVTKKEILNFIAQNNESFRHDPSNDKHTYTRNRIRHKVVPVLTEENPNISDSIRIFVEKQQQDEDFLQMLAKEKYEQLVTVDDKGVFFLDTIDFARVPIALQRRVILLLLDYLYKNSETLFNERLIESILLECNEQNGNSVIHLPSTFFLVRNYNKVQFTSSNQQCLDSVKLVIEEDCWIYVGAGFSIYLTRNLANHISGEKWFVQLESDLLPLTIRQKVQGDRMYIKGMSSPKKISRLFIDEKISANERVAWPLLVTPKDDIIAVIGLRYGERFAKQFSSQNYALYIKRVY